MSSTPPQCGYPCTADHQLALPPGLSLRAGPLGGDSRRCRRAIRRGAGRTNGAGFKLAPRLLPGFVALLAVVVVTQLVTAIGAGAWFP